MKKFLKSFVGILLMLAVVVLPLTLAGCKRNYTITIEIAEGDGDVFLWQPEGSTSIVGENAVKGGEKFEYLIEPGEGYVIGEVLIDGEKYEKPFDEDGTYLYFDKVDKNHTVQIKFTDKMCDIVFMCITTSGEYKVYEPLTTKVKYKDSINLNEAKYGGEDNKLWFILDESGIETYMYNDKNDPEAEADAKYQKNKIFVHGDITLYCRKTSDWLDANLVK